MNSGRYRRHLGSARAARSRPATLAPGEPAVLALGLRWQEHRDRPRQSALPDLVVDGCPQHSELPAHGGWRTVAVALIGPTGLTSDISDHAALPERHQGVQGVADALGCRRRRGVLAAVVL